MTESTSRETLESANENNKAKRGLSSSTFLQQFVKDYVEKRPSAVKNELIEEVMKAETLSGTKASQGLMEFRASDEKYSDINLAEIDVFMLRKQLAKGFLQLAKARQDLETQVLKNYDITPDIYETKVSSVIKTLSLGDIQKYRNSEYQLEVFLKKHLGKTVSSRVKFDMLAGISEAQMQQRVRAMKEPQKTEIALILKKLQNAGVPRDDEIRALVESSLFDEVQKVTFVQTFMPFISLQKAVDIGLLEAKKAEKIQDTYISDILKNSDISADNKKEIEKTLSFSDIQVATRELVKSTPDVLKVSEAMGFQEFVSDLSTQKEEKLEKLRSSGPKTFEGLQIALAGLGEKCKYALLFAPENIVKFTKSISGEQEIHYVRIGSYDDEKQELTYQSLGGENINLSSQSEYKNIRYEDFFANLSGDPSTSFEAMTRETVEAKIGKKEILSSELQLYTAEHFSGVDGAERGKEIQQKEIQSLQEELSQAKSKVAQENSTDNLAVVKTLEKQLEKTQQGLGVESLVSLANKFALLEKINEIDPQGASLGLGDSVQKVAFYTGKGENTYTIQSIDYDSWTISLLSRAGPQSDMDIDSFYQAFKEQKPKRMKSIRSEDELVSGFGEAFAFKDGDIIEKEAELNGEKKDRVVEYLANDKHKLIKVVSISGGYVEFQEGEIHEGDDDHGDHGHGAHGGHHGHGKTEKKYSLKIKGASLERWTLDEFHRYTQDEKLKADWKLGQNYEEHPLDPKNPTHGSFIQKFMKGLSFSEIIHGGQMVVEGITETLHHGSHAKSAHAALAMAKWLPEELRDEMYMKVEAAEGEETENAKKKLGAIDSWMAVERIEKWLKNRDTPQYKLEAGALFMMEKYGHLTAKKSGEGKKGLYQYRGKFLWYERLGGHIGDDLYNRMKKQAEEEGQTFSEEKLVHFLLKEQCNSEKHHYSGVHRRSRVHKEFERAWSDGISGETEKGEKDATAFRSSTTMAKEGMGEIKGGTTTNGLAGWAHRAATKGTANNIKDYMLIPSVILLSGSCYDIDQKTYTQVKSFWDEGIPVIGFRMFGNVGLMNLFRDTVKDLSWEIQQAYPSKYPHIYEEAQKIHKAGKERTGTELTRLSEAEEFWNKYGEVLTRSLHMSLASDVNSETDFSKTDSIIKRKRNENPNFAKYYKLVTKAVDEGEAFKKEYVEDWVGDTGFFGLNVNEITKKYLQLDQGGGFRMGRAAEKVWEQIQKDINATPHKVLVAGKKLTDDENRREQKKYLVEILQELISGYLSLHGGNESALRALSRQTSNVGSQLKAWGIDVTGDLSNYSPEDILEGGGSAGKYIEQIAENIISGKSGSGSSLEEVPSVLQVKKNTQVGVAANLSGNPNGGQYRNAA